ncbi:MAG: hypothetical protein IPN13_14790 [Bacteroidetes bacterium]|nr:hypothetical protein [Bacteroidota bacterium]
MTKNTKPIEAVWRHNILKNSKNEKFIYSSSSGNFTNSGFTQAAGKSTDNENKLKIVHNVPVKILKEIARFMILAVVKPMWSKLNTKPSRDIAKQKPIKLNCRELFFKDYKKGILNNGWVVGGNYNGTIILVNAKMNATGTLKCGCCGVQSIIHDGDHWVSCATPSGDCKKCDED